MHIPKTAGTTLHKIITHQYPRRKIIIRHDSDGPVTQDFLACLKSQEASVVMGHFSVGLHEAIPSLRYVTCLRNPVARIVSHYRHALNDRDHYLHRSVVDDKLSLSQYVSSGLSGELSNGMTRMLAGIPDFHHGTVDQETLALALSNIESHFDAVIPSERFDEGILMLAGDLGWKTPYYLRRKVGRYPSSFSKQDAQTIRVIENNNRFDRKLYDLCLENFSRRADQHPDLPQRLVRFQHTNPSLGKAIFLAREFKNRMFDKL